MILVTGATGLVGGHLMWQLLQQNDCVTAIRRSTSNLTPLRTIFSFYTDNPDKYLARIDWRQADVLDMDSLVRAMPGIEVIYHCAAIVSLGNESDILLDTNVVGTRNIVQVALESRIRKFCFVSSIAACGKADKGCLINENCIWDTISGRSMYAQSKYYSEQEVWKGIALGLNAVIVNPGVILGVSGINTGSSQLFYRVRKGLVFYTNGGSGYVDVRDVARRMIALTNSTISGERFVLVGENCSNKDLLSWIADSFGKRRPWLCMGRSVLLCIGSCSELIAKALRFQPLIDRGTARSATHREYYSSRKIQHAINFNFTSIKKCVEEVCEFMNRT